MRRGLKNAWAALRSRREGPAVGPRASAPSDLGRSIIDGVDDAVVVTDTDLRVVEWNAAMERMTGVDRHHALGADALRILPFLLDVNLRAHVERALKGSLSATGEVPYQVSARGKQGWVTARFLPRWDAAGQVVGVAAFYTDVTEERRRALFVRAIETIGRSLTSSLDLNEVLDTIVGKTREVMSADAALVVSWDGTSPELVVLRVSGRLSDDYAPTSRIPLQGGPMSVAVREGRSCTTANILTDSRMWLAPERRARMEKEGSKAVAAAPLASKGQVHGALVVHYWAERAFSDDDVAALQLLAEHAALAMDNARLYADATRRADRLRELAEVEQLVAASLDVDDVLRRITEATARLVDAPVVQLWTADPASRVLRLRAWNTAPGAETRLPTALEFGEGIAGRVAAEKVAIYVPDATQDPRATSAAWARESGIKRMLVVPILSGEELLGVLTVRSRTDALGEEENQALVTSFATQAAVAIQNARAYALAVRRAGHFRDLAAVSQSIAASLDTGDVMRRIVAAAAGMAPGAMAALHLYDAERGTLTSAATAGPDREGLPPARQVGTGLPSLVVAERRAVLVDHPLDHPRTMSRAWWQRRPAATYYGVPVLIGSELVGVLDYILPDRTPNPEEEEILHLLAAHAGVALRNASLYQAERAQAARIRALTTINRKISSTLDLELLLRSISGAAAELSGVRFVSFWLADEKRRLLTFAGGSVPDMAQDFPQATVSYDEGAAGWAARHREPVVVDDVPADARMLAPPWWRKWGLRSFLGLPVLAGDELVALLTFAHTEPIRFSADTRDVIDLFVAQAAIATQNARLFREAQRRRDVAEVLARLGRELTATFQADRIAELIVRGVAELVPSRGSSVLTYNPEDGTLRTLVTFGVGGVALDPIVLAPGEGVAGRAVAERKVVATTDILTAESIQLSPELRVRSLRHQHRAVVGVPLLTGDRVVGALVVGDDPGREFLPDEIQILQAVADQAALALENARLYGTARDSLERLRETQAQLLQAAKLSALGQLVSGVAHELNNPLSVIIGYGQLMLARAVPEVFRRPVELMVSQADRMAKIVRNLLFFARQRPPERAGVNLNQVIEQTLSLRLNQLTLSGIAVEKDFTQPLPVIGGDAQQLEQVFLNLLLNAEQAILESKEGGRIVFRTRTTDGGRWVQAQVIDDGPGIAPEALPRVFEPFFTTKTVGMGTGLGLSVSYGVVQEHRGRLGVESRPGETVFTLEFPADESVEAPGADSAEPSAEPAAFDGRLALVVEDEPPVLDLVCTLLGNTGWHVDVAPGGRLGLERVRRKRYDLIVSDMRMAEGSGEEFYRRAITEDPSLSRRFIFITGDTASSDAWSFLREAEVPIIEKPFQPALFLDVVRAVASSLTRPAPSA